MKTLRWLFFAGIIGSCFITGCGKEKANDKDLTFSGKVVSASACKIQKSTAYDTTSCLIYTFHPGSNHLNIKHTNVWLNCCPDSIHAIISKKDDTITIQESDNGGNCWCYCLHDLDLEIDGIAGKKYHFVIMPTLPGQDTTMFDLDFSTMASGTYCYP